MAWLVTATLAAQQDAAKRPTAAIPTTAPAKVVIPFVLSEANNLVVQAVLNGRDHVDLMFHTAANDVCLTKDSTKRLSSVVFDEMATAQSWGGSHPARFSRRNLLQIGAMEWPGLAILEDEHSGPGTDGKFGCNLLADRVVEIDFASQTMTVQSVLPEHLEGHDKLRLECLHGDMFVTGRIRVAGAEIENRFLIHTGFGGTVLFDDDFAQAHALPAKLATTGE